MVTLTCVAAALAVVPLVVILGYLLKQGAGALSLDFFTHMPKPVGEDGGGMANAILGTIMLIGIASLVGLPVGIGAGLYLAEQRGTRLANLVRFLSDVLNGLPSIVMGIFAWQFLVRPFGHFSALAGGAAHRRDDDSARHAHHGRDGAHRARSRCARRRWRSAIRAGARRCRSCCAPRCGGIVTGVLVAVARVAGETAPLLFTAFGNQFWSTNLTQPIAALPLQIFTYAISPYDDWHAQAWAGALVLIGLVLVISLIARFVTRARHGWRP